MKVRHEEERKRKTATHADKLKSESGAAKAAGKKFRSGKADTQLSLEERKAIRKAQKQGRKAARKEVIASREAHKQVDKANEDQNTGIQALNAGTEAAEDMGHAAGGAVRNSIHSRKLKMHRYTRNGDAKTGEAAGRMDQPDPSSGAAGSEQRVFTGSKDKIGHTAKEASGKVDVEGGGNKTSIMLQKKAQREANAAAFRKKALEDANQIGNPLRRFVDKAQDIGGAILEHIKEAAEEHPIAAILAVILLLLIMVTSGAVSSCALIGGSGENVILGTSYTAEDEDIIGSDDEYKDLEDGLEEKLQSIESEYPGQDEYNYELDQIGHNPYQLAALLTVLHEDYTVEEAREELEKVFDKQYELTVDLIEETRYRTEERTGYQMVRQEDGTMKQEAYTYEVQVPYQHKICNVKLRNKMMETVVAEYDLDADQTERYEILLETRGNKPYLFGEDINANPDVGDYEDYKVPGEALTDTQFAGMIKEAEKYLGRKYVYGGSTPKTGFDCSGFVCWVLDHSGNGYHIGRTDTNGLRNATTKISPSEAKPGDLIFFQGTYNYPGASHVGIYVGDGMMIHCGNPIQYSSVNTNYWKQHFMNYGRLK